MVQRLLICGFGPFPEAPRNPAAEAVLDFQAQAWSPPHALAAYAVIPTVWAKAPAVALDAMRAHAADGLLLIGVAVTANAFRIETLARNRASQTHPDAEGELWPDPVIDTTGPPEIETTAAAAAMIHAIQATGLPAHASDDAGGYLCNFTLYRLLQTARERPIGFLHTPMDGETFAPAQIRTAIRAAAGAFAASS